MLELKTRRIRYITIVDAIGRMDSQEDATRGTGGSLDCVIRELLRHGETRILLNFTGVTCIDSSGIKELSGIFTAVRRQGGEVLLVNPSKAVRAALHGIQPHTFFEITDDWAVALQSFSRPLAAAG
jgi:anti-anti-sigma factor